MCSINSLMGGPSGPTDAEKSAQSTSSNMAKTLDANYSTEFAGQQTALQALKGQISKFATGDTGRGFSPEEDVVRRSEIINNAAAGERNAQQASQNQGAGESFMGHGDTSGLARDSAIRQQIGGEIASTGENVKNNALLNETAANFETGRRNTKEAMTGYDALAGQYGSAAHSAMVGGENANDSSFKQAEAIHKESDAASGGFGKLLKLGMGMAGDFFSGGMSGLAGTGGESFIQKAGDFTKGGLDGMFTGNAANG